MLDFLVLGSVEARFGDQPVKLGRRHERRLLGLLLLEAQRPIATERLLDLVWDGDPPRSARTVMYTHISRLRSILRPSGVGLLANGGGYLVDVDPRHVDLHRFVAMIDRARQLTEAASRAEALADALRLWRGPLMSDVADDHLRRRVGAGIEELRLTAIESLAEAWLAEGQYELAAVDLVDLVERHPTRERFVCLLMTALYRAGRQIDALTCYHVSRERLRSEFGVDPGPELANLHLRVLQNDPLLANPPTTTPAVLSRRLAKPAAVRVGARQLPRDLVDFVGRDEPLGHLISAIPGPALVGSAPSVVLAIDGMAGVGKTALAVHAGHLIGDRYPDAHLYLDLRGHSDQAPLEPATALDVLLRQIGVQGEHLPEGLPARVARWRRELAGRRVLLLLDNVATSEQVDPVLPGVDGCLTLITSRRRLVGLDGAQPLSLDVLTTEESFDLQRRIVGDRIAADPEGAAEVTRLCGQLALAIRLAAARLAHRPAWTVGDLVARLRSARPAPVALTAEGRSLPAAFALSYDQVGDSEQRMFRLLALHPGTQLDVHAAAALADLDLDQAASLLDELVDSHLLHEPTAGRYQLHDLMRAYAQGLLRTRETPDESRGAIERLLDCYLHTAVAASTPLEVVSFDYDLGPAPRHMVGPLDAAGARQWFNEERANLVASISAAQEFALDEHAWKLTRALWRYVFEVGHIDDLIRTHVIALRCAQRSRNRRGAAVTRNYLASGYNQVGRLVEAEDHLRAVLAYNIENGNRPREANTQYLLAGVVHWLGRYPEAMDLLHRSNQLRAEVGDEVGVGFGYTMLGEICTTLGRLDEALDWNQKGLDILRRLGQPYTTTVAHAHLGATFLAMGRLTDAEHHLNRSIDMKRSVGAAVGESVVLNNLAVLDRMRGRHDPALDRHLDALAAAQHGGERIHECLIRNSHGVTLRMAGDVEAALSQHRQALAMALEMRIPVEEARALAGLADLVANTDPGAAADHREQALRIFKQVGV
ncbi:DNA-binding SARP family transcriptional activator [Asanoa ferruginea]|uniref:DNA-binding SARP family transcriptional activator n=1 Tax=Asanoa ferruginea TaxID=53367 RepID=A0A3D9ZUN8_9ACTN|nr:DNA-binding SARP family transcriptional activator [Asanoa ferruginea]GIF47483.1 SARP family transcriptional regulator [Asanoa ferruginea]